MICLGNDNLGSISSGGKSILSCLQTNASGRTRATRGRKTTDFGIHVFCEVAVVLNGEDGEPSTNDFVIYPQNNPDSNAAFNLQNLNISKIVILWLTLLLFFHGEPGWRPGMEHNTTKK